jgi:hypothetical protein
MAIDFLPNVSSQGSQNGRTMYRNPNFSSNEQPSDKLLQHHFKFCVLHRMRGSSPPPTLQDFEDDFDFRGPVMGAGQEFSETYMAERLVRLDMYPEDCGVDNDNNTWKTALRTQP